MEKKEIKKLIREGLNINCLGIKISRPSQVLIIMRGVP